MHIKVAPSTNNRKMTAPLIQETMGRLWREVGKLFVGNEQALMLIGAAWLAGRRLGHVLLDGVPGIGKTQLVNGIQAALSGVRCRKVQFTPDMLPAHLVGMEVFDQATRGYRAKFGVFEPAPDQNDLDGLVVLADECNRTPPKVQSAVFTAMQEGYINIGTDKLQLGSPFFVMATKNPIDNLGTYPMTEAGLDRFTVVVPLSYPGFADEVELLRRRALFESDSIGAAGIEPVLSGKDILEMQRFVLDEVTVGDALLEYMVRLVHSTRPPNKERNWSGDLFLENFPEKYRDKILWGNSPRASMSLKAMSMAWAVLNGRTHVVSSDVKAVFLPVMSHRMVLDATSSFKTTREETLHASLSELLEKVPAVV